MDCLVSEIVKILMRDSSKLKAEYKGKAEVVADAVRRILTCYIEHTKALVEELKMNPKKDLDSLISAQLFHAANRITTDLLVPGGKILLYPHPGIFARIDDAIMRKANALVLN